jgi:hypothetical protein
VEWTGNQEPCDKGEDKDASARTTKEVHLQLLRDQWKGISRARLEDLIDEGLKELVDDQMYYLTLDLELSPDEKKVKSVLKLELQTNAPFDQMFHPLQHPARHTHA